MGSFLTALKFYSAIKTTGSLFVFFFLSCLDWIRGPHMLIFYLNVALKNIFFCVSAPTSSLSTWTNWTSKLFLNINVTSISVILNGSWSSDVGPTYSKSLTVTCPLIAFLLFWAPTGYRLSLNVGCSRLVNNKMLTFANQTVQNRKDWFESVLKK